jgi:hypothetical protein
MLRATCSRRSRCPILGQFHKVPGSVSTFGVSLANACAIGTIILVDRVCDRVDPRKVTIAGAVLVALWCLPVLRLLNTGESLLIWPAMVLATGVHPADLRVGDAAVGAADPAGGPRDRPRARRGVPGAISGISPRCWRWLCERLFHHSSHGVGPDRGVGGDDRRRGPGRPGPRTPCGQSGCGRGGDRRGARRQQLSTADRRAAVQSGRFPTALPFRAPASHARLLHDTATRDMRSGACDSRTEAFGWRSVRCDSRTEACGSRTGACDSRGGKGTAPHGGAVSGRGRRGRAVRSGGRSGPGSPAWPSPPRRPWRPTSWRRRSRRRSPGCSR